MFGKDFLKYAREFAGYLRNHKYEVSPAGVYFPKANALARGEYTHWVTGYESELAADHNIIPDEGLNHFLDVVLKGPSGAGTQITSWYLMLHSGSGTPAASLTAANYNSTLSEIVSGTEGYTEATRIAWAGDAVDTANTEVTNSTTPATFTIVTASSLAVNGAGLVSVSTKGATSGVLLSAGKFSATRNLSDTDEFNLKYKVDLDAV
jgi:hypothetical protein